MTHAAPNQDIEELIAEFERSGLRELHVRAEGLELYLSKDKDALGLDAVSVSGSAPVAAPATAAPAAVAPAPKAAPAAAAVPEGATVVRAPYLGTFYRSPKPGSPAYVEQGDRVTAETELCLVEVMKLFTSVRAGVAGIVHAVVATDGAMVAADQPLFIITPA
jgi:acetyl-CoA carboxylase biotin carboxyl carrier protein